MVFVRKWPTTSPAGKMDENVSERDMHVTDAHFNVSIIDLSQFGFKHNLALKNKKVLACTTKLCNIIQIFAII